MPLNKKQKTTSVGNDTEQLETLHTVGGIKYGAAAMENSMEVPQKI